MTEDGKHRKTKKPTFHRSHTPWKSLGDYHIPRLMRSATAICRQEKSCSVAVELGWAEYAIMDGQPATAELDRLPITASV